MRPHVILIWLALAAGTAAAQKPLALDEALAIAEQRSALLAAQRAAAEAAAALVGPARENPDPKLFFGIENLPASGPDRFSTTADSMTMKRVGVMQDFTRKDKREAMGARAEAEAAREQAMVGTRLAELRREVASAWMERYYAERSRLLVRALMDEAQLQGATAGAELAGGRGSAADGVMARVTRAMFEERLLDVERQSRKAAAMLSRWLGEEADRPPGELPETTRLSREVRRLEVDVERHPEHAVLAPQEALAQAEAALASAGTKPDWSVELSYARRGGEYSVGMNGELIRMDPNMVSLMFRVDLPIFESRRQGPLAAARARQVDVVRAQIEDSRRKHQAEVRAALVDWETAIARLQRHRKELVPLAEERERVALAAYGGGRMELSGVMEARRATLEARLAAIGAEMELGRAWAQLAYLVPERTTP